MANSKALWVRARCSAVLKKRLNNYIEAQKRRGHDVKESVLLRNLLVDFLDRVDPMPSPEGTEKDTQRKILKIVRDEIARGAPAPSQPE